MDRELSNENQLLKYISQRFDVYCEDCERKDNLTVHHRLPRRSKDRKNAENLRILSQRCHRKLEGTLVPKKAFR